MGSLPIEHTHTNTHIPPWVILLRSLVWDPSFTMLALWYPSSSCMIILQLANVLLSTWSLRAPWHNIMIEQFSWKQHFMFHLYTWFLPHIPKWKLNKQKKKNQEAWLPCFVLSRKLSNSLSRWLGSAALHLNSLEFYQQCPHALMSILSCYLRKSTVLEAHLPYFGYQVRPVRLSATKTPVWSTFVQKTKGDWRTPLGLK